MASGGTLGLRAACQCNERPPAVLWQCLRGREENGEERGGNCQYGTPLAPLSSFNHLVHPAVRVPTQHPSLTPSSDPESDMTCARSQQIRGRRSRSSGTRSIARPAHRARPRRGDRRLHGSGRSPASLHWRRKGRCFHEIPMRATAIPDPISDRDLMPEFRVWLWQGRPRTDDRSPSPVIISTPSAGVTSTTLWLFIPFWRHDFPCGKGEDEQSLAAAAREKEGETVRETSTTTDDRFNFRPPR